MNLSSNHILKRKSEQISPFRYRLYLHEDDIVKEKFKAPSFQNPVHINLLNNHQIKKDLQYIYNNESIDDINELKVNGEEESIKEEVDVDHEKNKIDDENKDDEQIQEQELNIHTRKKRQASYNSRNKNNDDIIYDYDNELEQSPLHKRRSKRQKIVPIKDENEIDRKLKKN